MCYLIIWLDACKQCRKQVLGCWHAVHQKKTILMFPLLHSSQLHTRACAFMHALFFQTHTSFSLSVLLWFFECVHATHVSTTWLNPFCLSHLAYRLLDKSQFASPVSYTWACFMDSCMVCISEKVLAFSKLGSRIYDVSCENSRIK